VLPSKHVPLKQGCCSCVLQESKKLLEEKFRTGKNRWFFNKLRF
jgi:hypothetical protein